MEQKARILSTASPKKGARDYRSRQKSREMPGFCLPLPLKRPRATLKVDKNREKCLNFVYRCLQKWRARPRSRQKWSKKPGFCLPLSSKPRGLVSCHIGKCCQNQPARGPSSQRLIQMQQRITAASKSTGFYKKRTAENRTVLEMCRIYLFLSY